MEKLDFPYLIEIECALLICFLIGVVWVSFKLYKELKNDEDIEE